MRYNVLEKEDKEMTHMMESHCICYTPTVLPILPMSQHVTQKIFGRDLG
jgi:hypothetical protein